MTLKINETVATGRRKTAVASARLRDGSGKIEVNGVDFEVYFPLELQRSLILAPLKKVNLESAFDMIVRAKGGGKEGQAVAVRLAISRALVSQDETRRAELKAEKFLTRDPRKRERKKYGLAGARKRFQFVKR